MHTTFRAKQLYADIFMECARTTPCIGSVRPLHFMKLMEANQGSIGVLNGMGLDEEGLERKNPVNPDVPEPATIERVQAIRELADEEKVCLADVYAVWESARDAGCPWRELLANGVNHPGVEGHEVYALALMKLFEG